MKNLCLALVATAACGTSVFSQGQQLSGDDLFGALRARQIGPATMSGRISDIDVVESDPTIIYVGSAGGGVWKSQSGGTSFRPVFDDHTMSIGKVTIDQHHPDTVWVGTGEPWVRNSVSVGTGIYKTTNGGTRWEFKGLPDSERISDIVIDPRNPNTVYVAVLGHLWNANEERGVYRTTDGGDSWEKILYVDANTGAADLSMDPENPEVLYAAMWSHRRYPDFFDSGLGKAKEKGKSALYKTTDGGQSWNKLTAGLPQGTLGRMAVEVAPAHPSTVYLTVETEEKEKSGLYRSMDSGANWKLVNREFGMTVRPFYFSRLEVGPTNDSLVLKCGLNLGISQNAGESFRPVGSAVHSDVHSAWVDPGNEKHMIIGTDGGVYESYDGGYLFRMVMDLPVSQFYHVSVDNARPYNVYGGLQDNGSWYAPSQQAGGISNAHWRQTYGGDGFHSFRHPDDEDVIYSEYQGGQLVRYNKSTGQAKDIKPYPGPDEDKFRFNWNAPLYQSPNNSERIYFACQYLFKSEDRGDSWKRISPDLTTNNKERQRQAKSGGLSIDNSTAENNTTIYAIAESPLDENIVWAGTDDGNLQVSGNQGGKWTNVAKNIAGLPPFNWVSFIEPGHFDKNAAYVTFDNHRNGDMAAYVFKTTDLGKSWTKLPTGNVEGYALSIRQDLKNPDLLFLGTEFGLYISLNGGQSWDRFESNMPKVAVRDMVIHPREDALVMATHGRGVIILDDITPLRQLSQDVYASKIHFFKTKPTVLRDPGGGGAWFGGAGNFTGPNPNTEAQIIYYMDKRHTFGKMYVEVYDAQGHKIKELPAGKRAGINIVDMPTSLNKPKAAPTNNRMALLGALVGPNLQAGTYQVKLVKGKEEYETSFTLQHDPDSPYSTEDRTLQRETTMKLYHLTEDLAYIYDALGQVERQARECTDDNHKMDKTMKAYADEMKKFQGTLVALEGDFYVDEGERVMERISDLYRQVSSYPGRPSQSQVMRTEMLAAEMGQVQKDFENLARKRMEQLNQELVAANFKPISIRSKEEFLSNENTAGGASYQQFEKKAWNWMGLF